MCYIYLIRLCFKHINKKKIVELFTIKSKYSFLKVNVQRYLRSNESPDKFTSISARLKQNRDKTKLAVASKSQSKMYVHDILSFIHVLGKLTICDKR